MDKSKEQKRQMYTIMGNILEVTALLIMVVLWLITLKASEKELVLEYNARLEELCKWIDGYEIVNAEYDYECNPSIRKYTWTLTRLNNGNKETITVEAGTYRHYSSLCPIYKITRVSPDNKYHIVEDDGKLVVYRPNDYYDTVSKAKYSSK